MQIYLKSHSIYRGLKIKVISMDFFSAFYGAINIFISVLFKLKLEMLECEIPNQISK